MEEPSETPSADPLTEDYHQDPLLTFAHDTLSQPEILDSPDIAQLLSVNKSTTQKDSKHIAKVHRQFAFARANKADTQLIDRGTNGHITGSNMHVLPEMAHKINTVGIHNHELTGLPIVTTSVVLQTNQGPIIGIFHEYAHLGKGSSIHASGQLKWFHTQVNNVPRLLVGNNTCHP